MNRPHEVEGTRIGGDGGAGDARFTFTDFFCGIGGFRLGLEALGGRCVYSVERDPHARRTYGAWFGAEPEGGDINELDRGAIPARHTLMAAGFPCPAFSAAGVSKRNSMGRPHGLDDLDQGVLFFRLAEALAAGRPRAFIFENVKNLLHYDSGRTWRIMRERLGELDYSVSARVYNARHFAVPQHRERVIIVGFDKRLFGEDAGFRFPEPDRRIRSVLSCILDRCPDPKYTLSDEMWAFLRRYKAKHAAKGNGFGYSEARLDGITRTLSARYHKDGSEILVPQPGDNPRRLTPREAARLMGFPDRLPIVVSDTQAYRQFGNAVVPAMVEAVAAEVLKVIERRAFLN